MVMVRLRLPLPYERETFSVKLRYQCSSLSGVQRVPEIYIQRCAVGCLKSVFEGIND